MCSKKLGFENVGHILIKLFLHIMGGTMALAVGGQLRFLARPVLNVFSLRSSSWPVLNVFSLSSSYILSGVTVIIC